MYVFYVLNLEMLKFDVPNFYSVYNAHSKAMHWWVIGNGVHKR